MAAKSAMPSKLLLPSPNMTPYMIVTEKKDPIKRRAFALPGRGQAECEVQKVYGMVLGRCKESYPSEDAE
jgi:hypothetical protein